MTRSTTACRESAPAKLRVGILGCGAIVEQQRLPDARDIDEIEVGVLIDSDIERARDLAQRFGVRVASDDDGILAESVDAVLIALPNDLHAEYAIRLAEHGLHLMVEKPLALTAADCDRVIAAARENGVVLAVAMDRRFSPQYVAAKAIIDSGQLGTVTDIEVAESAASRWPSVTGFYFDPAKAGGGVLINNAIHTLDQLILWFGDPVQVDYADDHLGGPETECRLTLVFVGGVTATLTFSRLRRLANMTIIRGEKGAIELGAYAPILRRRSAASEANGDDAASTLPAPDPGAIWRDWARAIREGAQPSVSGEDGRRTVALIERCYGRRQRLPLPWVFPGRAPEPCAGLAGQCILVTGGSGFIGGRVAEMARLTHDARVRILTRDPFRARRTARLALDVVGGDITDPAAVCRAAAGCDIIVHCAVGAGTEAEQRAGTVDGTRNVVKAALATGVSRVVHLSTVMVYGPPEVGEFDETFPHRPGPNLYAETKEEAESIIWRAHELDGLPAVVIQPTIVYGPYGGFWTTRQIENLKRRKMALPRGLGGACDVVYIDDAAHAVLLAAASDDALGHAFLISGPDRLSWQQFYDGFAKILGRPVTFGMSVSEIRAWRLGWQYRWTRLPLRMVNRVWRRVPDRYRFDLPTENQIARMRTRGRVDTEKAKHVLGFRPLFDFERGMELTAAWAVAAGLVGDDPSS